MTPLTPETNQKIKNTLLLAIENRNLLVQFESLFSTSFYEIRKITSLAELKQKGASQPFDILICEEKFLEIADYCHQLFPEVQCIVLSTSGLQFSENFISLRFPIENKFLKQIIDVVLNYSKLTKKNKELADDLHSNAALLSQAVGTLNNQQNMSSHIQRTMLFEEHPKNIEGCELASDIFASQEIDSDFLDFYQPLPHILDVVIGDVMGKGLGSSLVGIATKLQIGHFANRHSFPLTYTRFDGWQEEVPPLEYIIKKTHEALVPILMEIEHFVSLLYGRFNLRTRQFSYIDCGCTNPIFYRHKIKKAERISSYHFPLGVVKDFDYKATKLTFEENDLFLFFSDGVIEVKSPDGEFFGENRLRELIEIHADKSPELILKLIQIALLEFSKDNPITNDLTIFAIKFKNLESYKPVANKPAKFNSVISQLHPVRQLVKEYCLKAPGNHTLLATELELVIDEVFSNIVKHSYKNIQGGSIYIHVEYQKEGLTIELSDQGESFNPAEIPHPNLFGDNDTGYGWFLIKHLVDHIIYFPKSTKDGWNRLRLFKKYFNKEAQMELTHTLKNDVLIVTLQGENLDTRCILEFKDKVAHLLSTKGSVNVVFDLHQVRFIDSSGLGAFLSFLRQLNTKGGQLKLANLSPSVRSIFELVSMHKIFDCYDTVDEAVQSFKSEA